LTRSSSRTGRSISIAAATSGSAFLYFGPDVLRFHAVFAKFGTMMVPWHAKAAIAAEAAE